MGTLRGVEDTRNTMDQTGDPFSVTHASLMVTSVRDAVYHRQTLGVLLKYQDDVEKVRTGEARAILERVRALG